MKADNAKKWFQIFLIGIIIVISITIILNNFNNDSKYESRGLLNQPAPIFTLQGNNQALINLSDYNNKGVILNFWASWCTPCVNELPLLNEAYKIKDFDMLAINVGETQDKIRFFSERYELQFPILFDRDQRIKNLYAISALPMTIVINKDGTVISRYNGELTEMKEIFELVELLD